MQKSKKSVLITGTQGFIGSSLLPILKSYDIFGLNIHTDKKMKNYHPIKKDLTKLSSKMSFRNIHGIIHLAAMTDVNECNKNPQKCFEVNVIGTLKMLEIARINKCKFLYVSTSHVYGTPQKLPILESHPLNPLSIYARSKVAAEFLCESYANSYQMDLSIVRLFSVYGPNSPPHLVTSRIISQLNNQSIKLGNLSPKRDFIYITDAVNAIKTIFEKTHGYNVYNVGSGKSYSIKNIYNMIMKISSKQIPIISDKRLVRNRDSNNVVSDSKKLRKLGWKPKTSLYDGLKSTLDWHIKKQPR